MAIPMKMRRAVGVVTVAVLAFAAACAGAVQEASDTGLEAQADAIHRRVIVVDPHVDVLLPDTPERYFAAGHTSRASIERLQAGGVGAVAFAIAVGRGPRTAQSHAQARAVADEKLAAIRKFVGDHAERVAVAVAADDVVRLHGQGKVAVLMSFLNARSLGTDPSGIDGFYEAGVRIFGLAHGGNNAFADSSRPTAGEPPEAHHGLSALGREAVERLNRLGAIIDVSQLSKKAVLQTVALSKAPVIASHSSVRALVDNPRNLDDEELDAIEANGGVVHVTPFNAYLARKPPGFDGKVRALRAEFGLAPEFPSPAGYADGEHALPAARQSEFDDRLAALFPRATVEDLVDHIEYVIDRIGIDHVGIGSDFNHGAGIEGFDSEADAPNVTRELVRRGYSEAQIAKIWGGNFLRVFREVEAVAEGVSRPVPGAAEDSG